MHLKGAITHLCRSSCFGRGTGLGTLQNLRRDGLERATELFADSLEQTYRPAAQIRFQQESHRLCDGPGVSISRGRLEADLGGSYDEAESIICEY
jgi:hypothetical protein